MSAGIEDEQSEAQIPYILFGSIYRFGLSIMHAIAGGSRLEGLGSRRSDRDA